MKGIELFGMYRTREVSNEMPSLIDGKVVEFLFWSDQPSQTLFAIWCARAETDTSLTPAQRRSISPLNPFAILIDIIDVRRESCSSWHGIAGCVGDEGKCEIPGRDPEQIMTMEMHLERFALFSWRLMMLMRPKSRAERKNRQKSMKKIS